jgi:hypothetical protein
VKPLDDAAREARSRPVRDGLFAGLEEQRSQVLPKSLAGTAIEYAQGNRAALSRYTEAEFLAIDNNASERALRTVAVGRKNYQFAGSNAGGRSAAVLYSVVGTCRWLGLDPFAYLRDKFARLPSRGNGSTGCSPTGGPGHRPRDPGWRPADHRPSHAPGPGRRTRMWSSRPATRGRRPR